LEFHRQRYLKKKPPLGENQTASESAHPVSQIEESVDLGMGTVAHLVAATDRNGRFSGYYRCSLCVAEFRPNPKQLEEMASFFAAHVRLSHCDNKTIRKDVSAAHRMYRKRR
jgi:hypothetical protein